MGALSLRALKNIWGHADDEYDSTMEGVDEAPTEDAIRERAAANGYAGGNAGSSRRLRSVPAPLRSREKNIYTLKPRNHDEAAIAADYLKTGSAVVLNLLDVERDSAVRIIDFMSGVCYGLEAPGHAMKLGDTIFLFTPGDFEITSDETDYGENPDYFFKEVPRDAVAAVAEAGASAAAYPAAYRSASPRAWEK